MEKCVWVPRDHPAAAALGVLPHPPPSPRGGLFQLLQRTHTHARAPAHTHAGTKRARYPPHCTSTTHTCPRSGTPPTQRAARSPVHVQARTCASLALVQRRGKETKAGIPADERGGRGRAGAAHTPSRPRGLPHRPAFPGCFQRRGRASLIACTWLLLSIQSKRDHKADITNSEELFYTTSPFQFACLVLYLKLTLAGLKMSRAFGCCR